MAGVRQWHPARTGHTVMTMADIWLTTAARAELDKLPPAQAEAVNDAIGDIPANPGQPLDIPGAPPAEPFLAKEPRDPDAPAVIYRRTTTEEQGHWVVVSLMNRADYRAFRHADQQLGSYPPAVREIVNAAVAGTVSTVRVTAYPGASTGAQAPTTGTGTPRAAG